MTIKYSAQHKSYPLHISLVEKQGSSYWNSAKDFDWVDQVSSMDMPGYKRKIARGEQATTYRSGEKQRINSKRGFVAMKWRTSSIDPTLVRDVVVEGHLLSDIGVGNLLSASDLTIPDNRARELFYAHYRSATTAFQGGVALGELGETIRMIGNPAKALRKEVGLLYDLLFKKLKKSKYKKARDRNKVLAETWLEGSFGWKPLISDIEGVHRALHERGDYLNRIIYTINGRSEHKVETHLKNLASSGYSNVSFRGSAVETKTAFVRYLGGVKCEELSPERAEQKYWGFDPSAIVPTVWELVPYSFLIDYFTNVGKVIDSLSMRRARLAWGVKTTRRSTTRLFSDGYNNSNRNVYKVLSASCDPGSWESIKSSFIREPIDSVPFPNLEFKIPGVSTKWLNIGALVAIKRKSKPEPRRMKRIRIYLKDRS